MLTSSAPLLIRSISTTASIPHPICSFNSVASHPNPPHFYNPCSSSVLLYSSRSSTTHSPHLCSSLPYGFLVLTSKAPSPLQPHNSHTSSPHLCNLQPSPFLPLNSSFTSHYPLPPIISAVADSHPRSSQIYMSSPSFIPSPTKPPPLTHSIPYTAPDPHPPLQTLPFTWPAPSL